MKKRQNNIVEVSRKERADRHKDVLRIDPEKQQNIRREVKGEKVCVSRGDQTTRII